MWRTAQRKGRPYAGHPYVCYPLANATDLLMPVLWTKLIFNGSKLRSYFLPFVDQSSPDYVGRRRRDRSLQCRFSIVDTLFHSRDICNRSAKSSEITPKKHVFQPQIFWGEDPQILGLVFKIAPISDHVAKFCGDRLIDHGDLALKKKKKERKKQQQNRRTRALR